MRLTNTTITINADNETLTFTDEQISKCLIHEEINLISDQLVPKTCDLSLYLDQKEWGLINPKLKKSQKITVSVHLIDDVYGIDKTLSMGVFYIDSWTREINNISTIKSVGYLAILDSKNARGSYIYVPPNVTPIQTSGQRHRTVGAWCQTFFANSGLSGESYELDPSYTNVNMVGTMPHSTMKDYLRRVSFAIGAVIEEDRTGKFLIYPQEKEIHYEIEEDRMIAPIKETKNNPVSTLQIDTYSSAIQDTTSEVIFSGNLTTSDTVVYFDKPIQLFDTPPSGVQYNTGGTPWYRNITVTSNDNYTLRGTPYKENINPKNSQSTINSTENNITMGGNQLVTSYNARNLSNKILETYNFYVSTLEFKYISNGEMIVQFGSIQIDYKTKTLGTIVSQDIDVSGGLITTAKAQISGFRSLLNNYTGEEYWTGSDIGLI